MDEKEINDSEERLEEVLNGLVKDWGCPPCGKKGTLRYLRPKELDDLVIKYKCENCYKTTNLKSASKYNQ